MTKAFKLLQLVQIHPLLWLVIAVSVATAHFLELSIMMAIIFIHEMGHAAAAAFFSWRIKKIVLLPFGGVAEMDEHGNRPLKEEAIVVAAGPLQHVWMIGLAYVLYLSSFMPEPFFQLFFQYNLMILFFNLFPIWPLDGGKMIFLLFSLKKSFSQAHHITLIISGFVLSLFSLFIAVSAPYHINVWVVIGFLAFSLFHEWKQRRYVFIRFLLERYYGKKTGSYLLKPIQADESELIIHVLERFQRGCKHPIMISGSGGEQATLDENEILHAYFSERRVSAKISDLFFSY
ncbi:M50 family metallopeptidase [Neobacillus sp. SM06]|uniref:M50 family metallopeptidase n=1 Tax=Neobacillus sp. SM06 TaxID=3422492 RepID=UPI003D2C5286